MSHEAFEFLQLADLRLEQPCGGMTEIPESLRELLLDAPYRAATKAVDLALEHGVEFVLLSGQTADLHRAGPRAALFLEQQFERLAEKQIPVYWAAGPRDPVWDDALDVRWPRNVRVFPRTHAETLTFERHGSPLARLVGRSGEASAWHLNDHVITESHLFTIGLGLLPPAQPDGKRWDVDYWSLHGNYDPTLPDEGPHQVPNVWFHDCGSPQGRSFAEPGTHGCTLVMIGEDRAVRTRPWTTDSVRYLDETVTCPPQLERKAIEALLRKRAEAAREQHPTATLFARWTLTADADHLPNAAWETMLTELAAQLRRDFGGGSHPLWTTEVRVLPQTIPAALLEQESLVGDYLRALHDFEASHGEKRNWAEASGLLGSTAAQLTEYLDWNQPDNRRRTLQEAAWLGVRLLSTEEVVG